MRRRFPKLRLSAGDEESASFYRRFCLPVCVYARDVVRLDSAMSPHKIPGDAVIFARSSRVQTRVFVPQAVHIQRVPL